MIDAGLLSVERAAERLVGKTAQPSGSELLPLLESLGRICFEDLYAPIDQPPFDRSPLDGYAVRHTDLAGASPERPARLLVTQNIFAGDMPEKKVSPGEAARIMTGAPIPPGADCVVRQEDTNGGGDTVRIYCALKEHQNICDRGEDLPAGRRLIHGGEMLTAAHLGVLAGQGYRAVRVFARPKVGVLSTGDELISPGVPLPPGKIYDSNLFYLSARLTVLGMEPILGEPAADDPGTLFCSVAALLKQCDAVITTGGVSVGQRDYMARVGEMLGAQTLFHGVDVKPGSPVLAMWAHQKPLVCLSGNPFAAAATLEVIARPMLCRLSGGKNLYPPRRRGILCDEFLKPSPGRRLVRARIEDGEVFLPPGEHVSGALSALIDCNCLLDVPAGSGALLKGTPVEVVLL